MSGQIVGYVRVSAADQNPQRQLEVLGECHKIFTDKISGKSRAKRQALAELLGYIRDDDTVRIDSLVRVVDRDMCGVAFYSPGMDIRRLVLPCARCCSSRRSRHHVSTSEAWYVCDQPLGMPLDCFDVSRLRDCVRNHLATSLRIPRVRQSCTRKCARRLLRLQPTFQLRIPQDRR